LCDITFNVNYVKMHTVACYETWHVTNVIQLWNRLQ